ncbi:MAG: S46 family peptidase [Chitinophagales bacterium]
MKKLIIALNLFIVSFSSARADEGMWIPILLEQLNIDDMRARGFKLTAEDIYSVNKSSMKDAVVLFGGGCTGEIISNEGLVLTNHHCGFSAINSLSSVENNYLKDGFWAKNKNEEKPCPGLSVTFIIAIYDVTDSILPYLKSTYTEAERNAIIREIAGGMEQRYTEGSHYGATVKDFYYGNEFYLFVTERFTDIRLVGAPPSNVGNFGGETDNWVWPRHTGDFSMFRIYANAENIPADYDQGNKPFVPRYSFPISIKGVQENDFTMVYGFPGRTQEYLPAAAVDLTVNSINPNRILVRDERLRIMNSYMSGNDTITLMYASKAKGLANAYKKWKGELIGLKLNDAITVKLDHEKQFQMWANTHVGKDYRNLLREINTAYANYKPYSKINDFTSEAAFGIEIINYASAYRKLIDLCRNDTVSESRLKTEADKLMSYSERFFTNYHLPLDREMFAALMKIYVDSVPADIQPPYIKAEAAKYNYDFNAWRDAVFKKTKFKSAALAKSSLTNFTRKKGLKLAADPVYKVYESIALNYEAIVANNITPSNEQITKLLRQYMEAQRLFDPEKKFYPDANSTLRVAFGNVKGYYAKDAVYYYYETTDQGIEQKYIPGDEEFDMPPKLIELMEKNDFGRYGNDEDELPIAFIATNHTTGGNSGSPVINANGELIGTNYDRVWEGTMSDIMFDPDRCRNISLDIRYTLFIVDKYAGAENIIKELRIVE